MPYLKKRFVFDISMILPSRLISAKSAFTQNKIIAYPTEGVWGLGCNPWSAKAVDKLLCLKQRDWKKGLIVVFSDYQQILPIYSALSAEQKQFLKTIWPGAVTVLLDNQAFFPDLVTGGSEKIALRYSAHPTVSLLCSHFGPLVSTSANLSGHPPCRFAWQIRQQLRQPELGSIVYGACGGLKKPTPIIDLDTGQRLRD